MAVTTQTMTDEQRKSVAIEYLNLDPDYAGQGHRAISAARGQGGRVNPRGWRGNRFRRREVEAMGSGFGTDCLRRPPTEPVASGPPAGEGAP
jgi:hypothetical protein